MADVKAMADGMVGAVKAYVSRALDPIATRLAAIEFKCGALAMHLGRGNPEGVQDLEKLLKRIEALEERLPLAYAGTWEEGQQSNKGYFFTYGGSIWYCKETTRDRPGTSGAFQLAVKKGAAAKG